MKIKNFDATIQMKLQSSLKKEAEKILASKGYSISEYLREKLEELVKEQQN